MKRLITLAFILCCFTSIYTQSIKGIIADTSKSPLISATVLLLDRDSTLLEFTQTDNDGNFSFKHISDGKYLIKTTYVGYIPATIPITLKKEDLDMGMIKMAEISIELYEVVIKAARAPMKIKGDTIEYDATTFKVPEGSTLEDLLKRLPGVEVNQDGSLKADGQDITKLTVEGKSFFGGDPKTATKNLPADGVSKVQVFDKKTDEQKITGEKSSVKEKEMNITLKEEFKKGGFGKLIGGAGTEKRYELKGNYNRFNDKHQFSVVGVGNNTGRNGLGWDDYQDFMGSQSYSFDDNNLEYGFNGGMQYSTFGGNNDGLESSIRNVFFSGGNNNGGFPKSKNGGINYNYEHSKTKLGARYFYNNNTNERMTDEKSTQFFDNYSIENNKTSTSNNGFNGHRAEVTFEQELDSFNTFVINANIATAASNEENKIDEQNLSNRQRLVNDGSINNAKKFDGNLFNTSAIYRKSFKKKGRFFGANFFYQNTTVDDLKLTQSKLSFYNESNVLDSVNYISLRNYHIANKDGYKFNTTFNEPLSKIFFLSVFYNYSKKIQNGSINVTRPGFEIEFPVNELSSDYINDIFYNRVGTSLRFSKNGVNLGAGLAYVGFDINATIYQATNPSIPIFVKNPFNALLPNASLNIDIGKNAYVSLNYNKNIQEPNINQLLPIVDNSNPLMITEGNPDLTPTIANVLSLYGSRSWPADGIRLSVNSNYSKFSNSIIMSKIVNASTQLTYSKPVNFNDGERFNTYMSVSFPIIKNRIKTNFANNYGVNKYFAYINGVLNETTTTSNTPRIGIDITPNDKIGLYLNGSFGKYNTTYNINTSQDQVIKNTNLSAQFNVNLGRGFFIATNYQHSFSSSDNFGNSVDIPILDASIYAQFLKGKKAEIRLSLYDAFNQNRKFNQMASANYVLESNTPSLARYFLISFTYNLRGMVGTVEKVY